MSFEPKTKFPFASRASAALVISLILHMLLFLAVNKAWFKKNKTLENKNEPALLSIDVVKKEPPATDDNIFKEPAQTAPQKPVRRAAPKTEIPKNSLKESENQNAQEPKLASGSTGSGEQSSEGLLAEGAGSGASEAVKMGPEGLSKINLNLSWNTFDSAFGEEAIAARESYTQASLDKRRGSGGFRGMSSKVKTALETNRGWIQPGNQEPLGDRRQVFYSYIYRIHEEKIHPYFGDGFWSSLAVLGSTHELNNMSLVTLAEFEILSDGAVNEIRVVKTSGNTVFDAAAVDSVYRSSPFPPPPKEILSYNNRVYLKWGFYRNQRMCGVFNVEPYILKSPDSEKEEIKIDDLIDRNTNTHAG